MYTKLLRYLFSFCALFCLIIAIGDAFDRGRLASLGFVPQIVSEHEAVVSGLDPGSAAARAGVRNGDRITTPEDWLRSLAVLGVTADVPVRVGQQVQFYDRRTMHAVRVVAEPIPTLFSPARMASQVIRVASLLFALMLFWRFPSDRAALALAWFFVCVNMTRVANTGSFAFTWPYKTVIVELAQVWMPATLALFACWFPDRRPRDVRRVLMEIVIALIAVALLLKLGSIVYLFTGKFPHLPVTIYAPLMNVVFAGAFAGIAIISIIVDFRRSAPLDRLRLEWVALGMALEIYVIRGFILLAPWTTGPGGAFNTVGLLIFDACTIGGTACLLYAFLRYRVLDLTFAVSRAAVFAVLSSFIVVLFIVIESITGKYIESRSHITSVFITLGIALLLGLSLRTVHDYIQRSVDRIVFRDRYVGRRELRTFTAQASFVGDESVLAERIVRTLTVFMGASYAVLYLLSDGATFIPVACSEREGWGALPADDAQIAALKESREPMYVESKTSALEGAIAFPMFVAGELSGLVACGPRKGRESYPPDDIDTIHRLVDRVGLQLDAIRTARMKEQFGKVRELMREHITHGADGGHVIARIAELVGLDANSYSSGHSRGTPR